MTKFDEYLLFSMDGKVKLDLVSEYGHLYLGL